MPPLVLEAVAHARRGARHLPFFRNKSAIPSYFMLSSSVVQFQFHHPREQKQHTVPAALISLLAPFTIDASHLPIFPSSAVLGPPSHQSSPF